MRRSAIALVLFAATSCSGPKTLSDSSPDPVPPTPAETLKAGATDTFFGTEVADPFRWLEDDVRESAAVADWVEAQNAVTFAYLEALPRRDAIAARLTEMWSYRRFGTPAKHGDHYYRWENDGLQPQSVMYRSDEPLGQPSVVIDPNTWSEEGTSAYAGGEFSKDGRLLAYGISDAGSDWSTWRVLDLASMTHVGGELEWIKFSGAAWLPDGSGFFYARYDAPAEGDAFQAANLNQQIFLHRTGTEQSEDRLIYARPDHPTWSFAPILTEDGRWMVVHVWESGTPNLVHVLDLQDIGSDAIELVAEFTDSYSCLGGEGTRLWFETNADAPRGSVVTVDIAEDRTATWTTVVPEGADTLQSARLVGNRIVAQYMSDASTRVRLFEPDGSNLTEVALPGIGTADGFGGKLDSTETFFSFQSFATPPGIYRYDFESGATELLGEPELPFDAGKYTVSQVFYESEDGTSVPMFLAHAGDLDLDRPHPTLLYGYGGFNISLTPSFSVARLAWMEMGGVFAMPNLRGGGEYGEDWHKAGTKLSKQNVFDDFISAAEYLIAEGWTTPGQLGIQGGSNGGLLVGACMIQRPDLFGACLPAVGVMDMLRFHLFTAGRYWVYDYGDVNIEGEFRALYAYSPYHNLEDGVCYPPTMVTTADTDDRVVPGHSFKFAARLQEAQGCDNPTLIRIETSAGHGAGKPITKTIEETADAWAFLAQHLGL